MVEDKETFYRIRRALLCLKSKLLSDLPDTDYFNNKKEKILKELEEISKLNNLIEEKLNKYDFE